MIKKIRNFLYDLIWDLVVRWSIKQEKKKWKAK